MNPFIGFAPDLPPETPGVFTDCVSILPGIGVFSAAPSSIDAGLGALDGAAMGFAVTRKLDGSARVFAGTSDKLYEVSGTWTDKSKGGGYSIGPDDRWRFAQFGDVSLAAAKSATIQAITTGNFADASGTAPKAAIIETANNQVFAFNINGMGFGDDPTRWACSAIGSYTDWTPSVATQCVSGQLLDSPGPITAGKRLGNVVIAYKDRAMYVGQYVGAPLVWDFQRIPGDIGAPCHEAVINTGTAHFFIGPDDFYIFDGSRPIPIPANPCRSWFFNTYDQKYAYKICGTFDRINQRVYWYFPSIGSNGALNKCIIFNIKTGQWGRDDRSIELVAEYVSSGITYDQLGTIYSTYDSLPTNISYDSPFWTSGSAVVAVFQTDHKAYQLSGAAGESRIMTGHYGENTGFSTVSRIRPRFISSPTSSSCVYSYSNTDASTFVQNITTTYTNNWYDLLWSARWHKFEFSYQGNHSISGMDLVISPDGTE